MFFYFYMLILSLLVFYSAQYCTTESLHETSTVRSPVSFSENSALHPSWVLASPAWLHVISSLTAFPLLHFSPSLCFIHSPFSSLHVSLFSSAFRTGVALCQLHTASKCSLDHQHVHFSQECSCTFFYATLYAWNTLPKPVNKTTTVSSFRNLTETQLYHVAYGRWLMAKPRASGPY